MHDPTVFVRCASRARETDTTGNNETLFAGVVEEGLNAMPGQSKFLFKGASVPPELHKKMTITDTHIVKARGFAYWIGNMKHGQLIIDFLIKKWGTPPMLPPNYTPNWLATYYPFPDMDPKVYIVPAIATMTIAPEPALSRGQKIFVLIPDAERRSLENLQCLLIKEGFVVKNVTFPGDEPTALWTFVASEHSEVCVHLSNIGVEFTISEMSTPPRAGTSNGASSIDQPAKA